MTGLRVGVSAALGLMVTLGLVFLMFKLIDSGSKELDEGDIIKIPDFLHVERELTENAKKTDVKKPDEPETPPPEIPEDKIDFEVPDNAVSMAAPVVSGGLNASMGTFARDSDFIPVYVPQPQYPRRAQTRGKEGYAVVEVIITTTGGVRDPKLLEELPEGWGFGRAAVKAATKLKYNPRVIDGVGQEVPGVLYKFSFNMAK
ncbi:energy transducer TonB [Porticoccaceae bacterium]|jgi:protein TonB|nr:energy transducer TonB [Porticoccaceae bacterium]MDA7577567.1 energy transducer TonB [bacterium]MDB3884693.1 energy transducer TonB [Porticoccaceae bacterium]MDC3199731.1 energy transducer TonB [Porticoccaceae bacterium]MDG1322165.1 energy transducer TonB [Porticoccaceae bacterium]